MYLAGIECDGATYHRLAAARDRDKTRQQVLANLGWQILRVWAPDWWHDPDTAIADLHSRLTALLDAARQTSPPAAGEEQVPASRSSL
jgi:very-short-patch-repair endonuclease